MSAAREEEREGRGEREEWFDPEPPYRWPIAPPEGWTADDLDVLSRMTVKLDARNRPEPDVIVFPEAVNTGPDQTWYEPGDILLAVEVTAADTRDRDREVKPRKYAAAGVRHFWRVEQDDDKGLPVVYVYELDPATKSYALTGIFHDRLKPAVPFEIDIDLTAINRRPGSRPPVSRPPVSGPREFRPLRVVREADDVAPGIGDLDGPARGHGERGVERGDAGRGQSAGRSLGVRHLQPDPGEAHGGARCPRASSTRSSSPGVSAPTLSTAIPASSTRAVTPNPARS